MLNRIKASKKKRIELLASGSDIKFILKKLEKKDGVCMSMWVRVL